MDVARISKLANRDAEKAPAATPETAARWLPLQTQRKQAQTHGDQPGSGEDFSEIVLDFTETKGEKTQSGLIFLQSEGNFPQTGQNFYKKCKKTAPYKLDSTPFGQKF